MGIVLKHLSDRNIIANVVLNDIDILIIHMSFLKRWFRNYCCWIVSVKVLRGSKGVICIVRLLAFPWLTHGWLTSRPSFANAYLSAMSWIWKLHRKYFGLFLILSVPPNYKENKQPQKNQSSNAAHNYYHNLVCASELAVWVLTAYGACLALHIRRCSCKRGRITDRRRLGCWCISSLEILIADLKGATDNR